MKNGIMANMSMYNPGFCSLASQQKGVSQQYKIILWKLLRMGFSPLFCSLFFLVLSLLFIVALIDGLAVFAAVCGPFSASFC
jgi:hypothetical protein